MRYSFDFTKDAKDKTFLCKRDANCCKNAAIMPLTDSDLMRLSKNHDIRQIVNLVEDDAGFLDVEILVKRLALYPCNILEDNSCGNYSARPMVCRTFPFTLGYIEIENGNITSGVGLNSPAYHEKKCSGICTGKSSFNKEIFVQAVNERIIYVYKMKLMNLVEGELLKDNNLENLLKTDISLAEALNGFERNDFVNLQTTFYNPNKEGTYRRL